MDLQLQGKRALVTGSTAGIGYAIAESLAREGADVVLSGRTEERVKKAIAQLKAQKFSGKVDGIAADLGTEDGVQKAVAQTPSVDILVNNLGVFEPKDFEQISDADWFRFFEVNVLSGVRLSRAYLPEMQKTNWGRIIFISSESALQIPSEMIHYGMTKTAQLAIARGLAEITKGSDVTVNAVLPGPTKSEGVGQFVEQLANSRHMSQGDFEQEFFAHMRPSSLLQRFERPDEIAAVVTFLASPLSSAINGTALRADGGVVRSIA